MKKFRDIISGTVLGNRLNYYVHEAQTKWLRDLGKNDFIHSQNVEINLNRLVPDLLKSDQNIFDHGEIFLMLVAVYLHDIGRRIKSVHHEIESYSMIRNNPGQFHLDQFEAEAVAQICAAHADESIWPIEKCDKNYGIFSISSSFRPFNLQRLGTLLRIADEIDNAFVRVNGIAEEEKSVRNIIRDINPIPSKGIIEIQAQPRTWDEHHRLGIIQNYTQKRLREVGKYLEDIGLEYYQVWLRPDNFVAPLFLPEGNKSYEELVEDVATLIEPFYHSVEILTRINDIQISILCTDMRIGIESKIAMLVATELDEVQAAEFCGALSYLREKKIIHNGVVVVNKLPTLPIQSIILDKQFHIRTLEQLVVDLYNFQPAMNQYIRQYEYKELYGRGVYINLCAYREVGGEIDNLEEHVMNWASDNHGSQLTILGDYGSGKTTTCERVVYECAKKYLADSYRNRVPLILKLKDVGVTNSIESLITNHLVNELKIDINFKTFETLNKAGRFLIILDGFDEMNMPTEKSALKAFKEIDKLVDKKSKIVLTCRTHFFKDNLEIHELHKGSSLYESISDKYGYDLIFIKQFSEPQINEYIEKWAVDKSNEYKAVIGSVYNLSDLACRPVLLNIIVKTIPQLGTPGKSKINAASLYETYIKYWLKRDDWRPGLKVNERRALAESISTFMFINKLSNIHFSEMPALLKKWIPEGEDYQIDLLDHELRTCNFLYRDHRGNYSFVHKSFMEYLLSSVFLDKLFHGKEDLSVDWYLPLELKHKTLSKRRIASNEIQLFVLQLADLKLLEYEPQAVVGLLNNRPRAQYVISQIISALELRNCGVLLANLLIRNHEIDIDLLITMILKSDSLKRSILHIIDLLMLDMANSKPDLRTSLERVQVMFDALKDNEITHNEAYVAELEEVIRNVEIYFLRLSEQPNRVDGIIKKGDEYPYSLRKHRLELGNHLNSLAPDVNKADAKAEFIRSWFRAKAEYDQKIKMHYRRDDKSLSRQLDETLKSQKSPKRKKKRK